jgi:hypothetical protein
MMEKDVKYELVIRSKPTFIVYTYIFLFLSLPAIGTYAKRTKAPFL